MSEADDSPIIAIAMGVVDPEQQKAYLDQVCGNDDAKRQRIEEAISTRQTERNVEIDALELNATVVQNLQDPSQVRFNQAIEAELIEGRYKLVSILGEGGMGSVYLAEQVHPVKRSVALKLIRSGLDKDRVLSRFELERQALAVMDHPGIAKILDAGTMPDGQPFFVMEFVHGLPLCQFCDQQQMTIPKRLELFLQVCHAVQHAHQKGIIHRDLKPGNILVSNVDDQPMPRIIDFGLAKALSSGVLPDASIDGFLTTIGTPLYMAPEQAGADGNDIDTRADVYALGVILYELLTGLTPIDKQSARHLDMINLVRMIREVDYPPPSIRLGQEGSKNELAAMRNVDPRQHPSLIRGDLDWITMKCLQRDRNERYASVGSVIHDLQRYFANEPVTVGPQNYWYLSQKLVKRNRGAVIAGSLIIFALIGGIVVAMLGLFEAKRQEHIAEDQKTIAIESQKQSIADAIRANQEADTASEVTNFLIELFQPNDRFVIAAANFGFQNKSGRSLSAHDILTQGVARLNSKTDLKPLIRARLLHEIAGIYFSIGDTFAAIPLAEESLKIRRSLLPGNDPELGKSLGLSAQITFLEGDFRTCVSLFREAIVNLKGQSANQARLDLAEAEAALGIALSFSASKEPAALFTHAYETYQQILGPDDSRTLMSGWLLAVFGSGEEPLKRVQFIEEMQLRLEASKTNPELVGMMRQACQLLLSNLSQNSSKSLPFFPAPNHEQELKRWRELIAQLNKICGEHHYLTCYGRRAFADYLYYNGVAITAAEREHQRVRIHRMYSEFTSGSNLTPLRTHPTALEEAAMQYVLGMKLGPKWERNINRFNFSRVLMKTSWNSEAEKLLHDSLNEFRQQPPELNRNYIPHTLQLLAWIKNRKKLEPKEIDPFLDQAVEAAKNNPYTSTDRLIDTMFELGHFRLNYSQAADAVPLFATVIELQLKSYGERDLRTIHTMAFHESALRKSNQSAEADRLRQRLDELKDAYNNPKNSNQKRMAEQIKLLMNGQTVPWIH